MAKLILVANWKNHPNSLAEAKILLKGLSKQARVYKNWSTFIVPPTTYLSLVNEKMGSWGKLGSQDISNISKGTQTGSITPDILKSFGVKLSIIGHSERRAVGESSEQVSLKAKIALQAGIVPLVCVGETSRDSEGEHFEFLREQIKASLNGLNSKMAKGIILAYEPVWAIGKTAKEALTPADLSESILFIRKILTDLFGRTVALSIPILYGGSVEPTNAASLIKDSGVRGFLVGHASLSAKSFETIAKSNQ
jgi:triosephosphate isomerase (TIM)